MIPTATSPHVCPAQFAIFLDNWMRRWIQPPGRIVGAYIRAGDTVLDLGCGPGFFTLEMARRVGEKGRVYAVDLQAAMLARVGRKAERQGLQNRIHLHRCSPDRIGLAVQADFALAYYMVHETASVVGFLNEVFQMVRPGGRLLVVEPRFHVGQRAFEKMCQAAREAGWTIEDQPKGKGGRSLTLNKMKRSV
jgi:ubiquinone/menaquinone biosynthesis C-methylase UbiE